MLASLSQNIAKVLAQPDNSHFVTDLMSALHALVPFDNGLIVLYRSNKKPVIEFNDPEFHDNDPDNIQDSNASIKLFLQGAYLLDPFYRAARKNKNNDFCRLADLAPDNFKQSEYYKQYYRHTDLRDEVGYLIHVNDDCFINISIGRIKTNSRFSRTQLQLFSDITPLIAQLCINYWRSIDKGGELQEQLEQALTSFGTTQLTNRESQVMQLLLHGHSTKSIARVLEISPETVKLYRKNSYAKLQIASQGELFHLFVDSLVKVDNYQGGDPLQHYFDS